ncbi:MAG: hypothetical protein NTW19_11950 [Planctomycetota bacterium]|nr:hypothetical protein [Planctomycetota bacterium]
MAIYLDGGQVTLQGGDLAEVLAAARERVGKAGRMIVEVELDGKQLVGAELEAAMSAPVEKAELRLITAEPRELALAALQQVRGRLDDARDRQSAAADLLQKDRPTEAVKEIGLAMEAWQETQQAISFANALLDIDLTQREFEGAPASEVTNGLIDRLKSLRDLIEGRDTVGLADSLQYEWSETAEQWQRLIDQMVLWVTGPEDRTT